MYPPNQPRRNTGLLDEAITLACAYLLEFHGLRAGIDFNVNDAVSIAAEKIGEL